MLSKKSGGILCEGNRLMVYRFIDNNKKKIKDTISTIHHETNGILGYRTMKIFLERKGIFISKLTTHKYMNKDLQIKSVNQKKKSNYKHGHAHKKFANLINQSFTAAKKNTI